MTIHILSMKNAFYSVFAVTILPRLDTFFHPQCAQSLYSHRLPNGHEIARAHIPHPDHLH